MMFPIRMIAVVLIVASVKLESSVADDSSQPEQLLRALTTLARSPNLQQRCETYEKTIRTFMPAKQADTASKDELYTYLTNQAASKQALEPIEKRVVDDIKQCADLVKSTPSAAPVPDPGPVSSHHTGADNDEQHVQDQQLVFEHGKAISSFSDANQLQQAESLLAQLHQAHEQSTKQRASNSESDSAQDKSIALEREQDWYQREVSKEVSLRALRYIKLEIESFRHDFFPILSKVASYYGASEAACEKNREAVRVFNSRVDSLNQVLKGQLQFTLYNIDALKAKQRQESQQYEPIREVLSEIASEFDFEQFKRDLAQKIPKSGCSPGFEEVKSIARRFNEYLVVLNGKLDMVLSSLVAVETKREQGSQRRESETRHNQDQPQPQHLDIQSELAQIRQIQGQLIERQTSVLERLASDLAQEKSRSMETKQVIVRFQRGILGEKSAKVLREFKSEFESFELDISKDMKSYLYDIQWREYNKGPEKLHVKRIKEKVDNFKVVMKEEVEKSLKSMEKLKAKQGEQEDQQYETIKQRFSKLESELEKFRQSIDEFTSEDNKMSYEARRQPWAKRLEEFHGVFMEQLDAAFNYCDWKL